MRKHITFIFSSFLRGISHLDTIKRHRYRKMWPFRWKDSSRVISFWSASLDFETILKRVHRGYLSPPYQLRGISRTQRNLAIVERCRRPDVSTQTYLTPGSRYRHSTSVCVFVSLCSKRISRTVSRHSLFLIRFEIRIDNFIRIECFYRYATSSSFQVSCVFIFAFFFFLSILCDTKIFEFENRIFEIYYE